MAEGERNGALEEERTGSVPTKVIKNNKDADDAMKAFAGFEGQVLVLDEATNKRLLRKIDWNIMPVHDPQLCKTLASMADHIPSAALCCLRSQLS